MPIPFRVKGRWLAVGLAAFCLASLSGCIAGAARDGEAVREEAMHYPEFRAENVMISRPSDGHAPAKRIDRDNYFFDFENHVHVAQNVATRMESYRFEFSPSGPNRNELLIRVIRNNERVISELIPRAFYMGDLQAAVMGVGAAEYLLLAANTRGTTDRRWFGIYRADGTKLYSASLERSVVYVRQNDDGISLFFFGGDSMRIRLR